MLLQFLVVIYIYVVRCVCLHSYICFYYYYIKRFAFLILFVVQVQKNTYINAFCLPYKCILFLPIQHTKRSYTHANFHMYDIKVKRIGCIRFNIIYECIK